MRVFIYEEQAQKRTALREGTCAPGKSPLAPLYDRGEGEEARPLRESRAPPCIRPNVLSATQSPENWCAAGRDWWHVRGRWSKKAGGRNRGRGRLPHCHRAS